MLGRLCEGQVTGTSERTISNSFDLEHPSPISNFIKAAALDFRFNSPWGNMAKDYPK